MRGKEFRSSHARSFRQRRARAASGRVVETLESRTLLSAGDLDPTFGTGGKVTTDFPGSSADRPRQIALQEDGSLLEVAWHSGFGAGEPSLSVTRFDPFGDLDTSFGDGGIKLIDFPGRGELFGSIDIAPDGKIAIGTWSFFPSTDFLGADSDVSVAMLNPDGSFDTSFDGDGMKVFDVGRTLGGATAATTSDIVFDIAVQDDGKVVAVSSILLDNQGRFAVSRLTAKRPWLLTVTVLTATTLPSSCTAMSKTMSEVVAAVGPPSA